MPISDTVFRPGLAVLLSQNPVEEHLGSDCSGGSGTTNRTLTTSKSIFSSTIIVVDGLVMKRTTQISISGNTITFIDALYDASVIEVY